MAPNNVVKESAGLDAALVAEAEAGPHQPAVAATPLSVELGSVGVAANLQPPTRVKYPSGWAKFMLSESRYSDELH